jgi:hypothetical protein
MRIKCIASSDGLFGQVGRGIRIVRVIWSFSRRRRRPWYPVRRSARTIHPLRKPDTAPIPRRYMDRVTCDDDQPRSSRDGVGVRRVVERVGGVNSCFCRGDVPLAPWILECLTSGGLYGHRYLGVGSSRTPSHRCKHGSALDPGGYVLSCPCYPEQGAVALLTGERNRARVRRPRNMLALWSGRGGCYSPIISRDGFG